MLKCICIFFHNFLSQKLSYLYYLEILLYILVIRVFNKYQIYQNVIIVL